MRESNVDLSVSIAQNSNLVFELFHVIDLSDWQALKNIFHEDILYERPGYAKFCGLDRLIQFYQRERIIASGTHNINKVITEEDSGACWGHFIGVGKNGSSIDELFAEAYSFEDGKIRTRRSYFFRPAV